MFRIRSLGTFVSTALMVLVTCTATAQVINQVSTTKAGLLEAKDKQVFLEKQKQIDCLAMNIYHEARSEPTIGKIAVAWVTVNRVNTENYPDTICGVVHQAKLDSNGLPKKNQCQFSWYCDGKPDDVKNKNSWYEALHIATLVYYSKRYDPTDGAIMYHATYVAPYWKKEYEKTVRIDDHIFYK